MRILGLALLSFIVIGPVAADPVKVDTVIPRPAGCRSLQVKAKSVAFVHGGQWLVTVDGKGRARVLDRGGQTVGKLPTSVDRWQPAGDGDEVLVGKDLWNVRTGRRVVALPGKPRAVEVTPDGKWLLTSGGWTRGEGFYGGDGHWEIRLYPRQDFGHPRTIFSDEGPLSYLPVAVSPDARSVAAIRCSQGMGGIGPYDNLSVWCAGQESGSDNVMFPITAQFSPDSQRLVLAENPHPDAMCASAVSLWKLEQGKIVLVASTQLEVAIEKAFFSRDGRWIVGLDGQGAVLLFDGRSGLPVGQLEGKHVAAAAGPDGLALVEQDGQILLWPLSR